MVKVFMKSLRQLLLVSVISLGLISIIASNGGSDGDSNPDEDGGSGDYTASGTYDYDSTAQTLELAFGTNNFPSECGIVDAIFVDVIIEATLLQFTYEEHSSEDETLIRSSGTAGDILGIWTFEDSSLVFTFNADNTFTLVGTNFSCGG